MDIIKKDSVWVILVKCIIEIGAGSIAYLSDDATKNVMPIPLIAFVYLQTLRKGDYFSFIIQIYVCSHFVFGREIGGIYILSAFVSLLIFRQLDSKKEHLQKSVLEKRSILFLQLFIIVDILCVFSTSGFAFNKQILSVVSFATLLYLYFFITKIVVDKNDIKRFLYFMCIMTCYGFLASVNQLHPFVSVQNPFLPTYQSIDDANFDQDLFRCSGTLLNFEAYAEYCFSAIAILLPLIISGALKQISNRLQVTSLITVVIAIFAIIISGTRSSIILIPVLFIIIVWACYKKIMNSRTVAVIIAVSFLIVIILTVTSVSILDIVTRNGTYSLNSFSIDKMLNGESTNRQYAYEYGIKKISHNLGVLGEGYYVSLNEYMKVHFDTPKAILPDYHNLYLSSLIVWGITGATLFFLIFLKPLYSGLVRYRKQKDKFNLNNSLLLSFNIMLVFLFVNQYKIQFIREIYYFTLIVIFFGIYQHISKGLVKDDL